MRPHGTLNPEETGEGGTAPWKEAKVIICSGFFIFHSRSRDYSKWGANFVLSPSAVDHICQKCVVALRASKLGLYRDRTRASLTYVRMEEYVAILQQVSWQSLRLTLFRSLSLPHLVN